MKLEFSKQIFEKNSQIKILMKIRPVGAEFFHADSQAGRHAEATWSFSQFCEKHLKVQM
jgi:hypothetical protein